MMWLGMAGELGISAASWTSRSKIWLPAGEDSLGEGEERTRLGEEGTGGTERSVRMGDVVALGCFLSVFGPPALEAGPGLDASLADSSVFFLPMPKSPRILFIFADSLVSGVMALPASDVPRTFSLLDVEAGSNGSARGETGDFAAGPLCGGAVLARLIVDECACVGCATICSGFLGCREISLAASFPRWWAEVDGA